MAFLVRLITRRPCAFLVPLVDGVKGNIEQRRNLISGERALWLSAGRFAGLRHVYRSDLRRWAVRLGAGPQCCHCSILHIPIVAAYTQPATAGLSRRPTGFCHQGWLGSKGNRRAIRFARPCDVACVDNRPACLCQCGRRRSSFLSVALATAVRDWLRSGPASWELVRYGAA